MSAGGRRDAVIVDAVRTPVGRRGGALAGTHPVDLSAHVLGALVDRTGIDPALVDDVIWGCVTQTGEQSVNVGRNAVLAAGWPETVVATTIDRQCGSSQQAAHFAAAGVISGQYDVAVAGGVEVMSRVPMGAAMTQGPGLPFGPRMLARYAGGLVPQGICAELIARRWGLSRRQVDEYALMSHERAAAGIDAGRFTGQIAPVSAESGLLDHDEGVRRGGTLDTLGALPPAFTEDGIVTAANSSQISDGAAALLVTTSERAASLGLAVLARFHTFALAGVDPVTMLTGPIPATHKALARSGLRLDEIGAIEVNEAFATVVLAWQAELAADPKTVNPNGGAIALGHPLGSSGARLLTTLTWEMRRRGARRGAATMCIGVGQGLAMVVERP